MVESPPADAGDTGLCPSLGRSHMPQSDRACEPWSLSLHIRSLCFATGDATTVRGPRTAKKQKKKQLFQDRDSCGAGMLVLCQPPSMERSHFILIAELYIVHSGTG